MCSAADRTKQNKCAHLRDMPDNFAIMFKMVEPYCQEKGQSLGVDRIRKGMRESCCGFAAGEAVKNSVGEAK